MKKEELRAVACDLENEKGIFEPGYYYIMTPTFSFHGKLEAVTAMCYVLSDVSTVFDTGPYPEFFKGKALDMQRLEGSNRTILDRAGCVLHKMP